ncbi:conjugal transfer protein TraB [Streptomyces sp. NPDC006552]|uniref:conjugal transfer protein TraB n=1 Tax=Streptomyces sp. NPDC006552 TaxID=3157179 RepID=UPI0033A94281
MSDITPVGTGAASDDNSYSALQTKLNVLMKMLDDGATELGSVRASMMGNAKRCDSTVTAIENADFDGEFIELTSLVSTALVGAAGQVRQLEQGALDMAEETRLVRQRHAKKYGPLDAVRSGRRHKTPKPGVFEE